MARCISGLAAGTCAAHVCGRYSVNVLPTPGALCSRISPPSSRVNSRLMESPRPVPPYLRLVVPSACWNASKMIRCLSCGMPMPVSVTENAITDFTRLSTGWFALQPARGAFDLQPHGAVFGEFQRIRKQVLEHLLQPLGVGDDCSPRQASRPVRSKGPGPCLRPHGGKCARQKSRNSLSRTLPTSTSILPDSILLRSRMSLIRASRSVPEEWMVSAYFTCFGVQDLLRVLRQHLREDQKVVQRRAQFVAHVGQELATCTWR